MIMMIFAHYDRKWASCLVGFGLFSIGRFCGGADRSVGAQLQGAGV
jgi:hypothetical protein